MELTMKKKIKEILNKLPHIRTLYADVSEYKRNAKYRPGHFYSAIVSVDEIKQSQERIWKSDDGTEIKGIDLKIDDQLTLLKSFEEYYPELPFQDIRDSNTRYQFINGLYGYTDGIVLYSMLRTLKPKRVIEVGSGFSSALMLDVNQLFFQSKMQLTFIEPYPLRLNSLIREDDKKSATIIVDFVQSISLDVFKQLEAGDILFIDGSHVAKTGSDVNFIVFDVLPVLKSGVYIHFHDVFYPFEYPKQWVFEGRNWNEDYFLKAFLMYNHDFTISLFADYLHRYHAQAFENMPLCYKNTGGNLWIRKN
jgi:hypothetical protein